MKKNLVFMISNLSVARIGHAILLFGIALRIYFYFFVPAMFTFDEAMIYRLIANCGYLDILIPGRGCDLPCKHYPFLFLAMTKFLVSIFGNHHFVLRFIPFVSGIGALALFNKLRNIVLPPKAGLIALFLMATNWWAIYYGMNFKVYSCDLLVTVIMLLIFHDMYVNNDVGAKKLIMYACGGSSFVWLSNPSIFVLAAGVITLGFNGLFQVKKRVFHRSHLLVFFSWGMSFILNYWIRIRSQTLDVTLVKTWERMLFDNSGMGASILWIWKMFYQLFENPLVLMPVLGVVFFIAGGIWFYRHKRVHSFIMILTIVLTMAAAMLNKYIFADRLLLFLVPIFCILIAQGCYFPFILTRKKIDRLLICVLCFFLILPAIENLKTQITRDPNAAGCPAKFKFALKRLKEGDVIYVAHGVKSLFEYFDPVYKFPQDKIIYSKASPRYAEVSDEMEILKKYKRVWFFSNRVFRKYDLYLRHRMEEIGERKATWVGMECSFHLFEINSSCEE